MSPSEVVRPRMHPLLELPPEVARSLAIAHVVVAEADLEPSGERDAALNHFRESHAVHGEAWELLRKSLEAWSDADRHTWIHAMLALVCVANPLARIHRWG